MSIFFQEEVGAEDIPAGQSKSVGRNEISRVGVGGLGFQVQHSGYHAQKSGFRVWYGSELGIYLGG